MKETLGPRPKPRLELNEEEVQWIQSFQRMAGAKKVDGIIGGETLWLIRRERLQLLKGKFTDPDKANFIGPMVAGLAIGIIFCAMFLPLCS